MKQRILNFIKRIYASDSPTSSKRFFGSIGWIAAIVFIGIWQRDLTNELMYTSAALIGLDTVTKITTLFAGKKK